VDKHDPTATEAPWFGSADMFEEAGFREVARRKPARPVVRVMVEAIRGR